jgi:hypothetical protein
MRDVRVLDRPADADAPPVYLDTPRPGKDTMKLGSEKTLFSRHKSVISFLAVESTHQQSKRRAIESMVCRLANSGKHVSIF